jgi:hypothetical protein
MMCWHAETRHVGKKKKLSLLGGSLLREKNDAPPKTLIAVSGHVASVRVFYAGTLQAWSPISMDIGRGVFHDQSKYDVLQCGSTYGGDIDDDERVAERQRLCTTPKIHISKPKNKALNVSSLVVILRDGENTDFDQIPEFKTIPNLIYLGRDFRQKMLPATQVSNSFAACLMY